MKKAILIVLVVVLVLAVAAAGLLGYRYWYERSHIFIEDAVYKEDASYIDLRGTGTTMEHYLQLRAAMPECEIDWDVPFQGVPTDSTSRELTVTTLAEEDLEMLIYFPRLTKIDANGCKDYSVLELLRLAAALEAKSEHPLAKAILLRAKDLAIAEVTDFQALPGNGLTKPAKADYKIRFHILPPIQSEDWSGHTGNAPPPGFPPENRG